MKYSSLTEKNLREKNLDMIIGDTPAAIGADETSVQVKISDSKWLKLPADTKLKDAAG